MDAGSAKNSRDSEDETLRGLWSDIPPPLLETSPATTPPPIPAEALRPPRLPQLPGMLTLSAGPHEPEPSRIEELGEVTVAAAFRVEPAVGPVVTAVPPPMLDTSPPRSITPAATKRPKELLNPWEPTSLAPPEPAAGSGPDLRAGAIGFALGLAVAAAVALSMWPRAEPTPVAAVPEPTMQAPAASEPEPAEVASPEAEVGVPTLEQSAAPVEAPEPVAALPSPRAEVPTDDVVATRSASEAAATRARWRERHRARRDERAAAPEPAPAFDDGPVIGAEPTPAPLLPTPTEETAADPNLPTTPARRDVVAAIQAIQAQLRECAPAHRGHVASIRFTFVSDGRATSALVPQEFAGPAERSCVARTARGARVPPFSDARLVVTYPVQF